MHTEGYDPMWDQKKGIWNKNKKFSGPTYHNVVWIRTQWFKCFDNKSARYSKPAWQKAGPFYVCRHSFLFDVINCAQFPVGSKLPRVWMEQVSQNTTIDNPFIQKFPNKMRYQDFLGDTYQSKNHIRWQVELSVRIVVKRRPRFK